MKLLVTLALLGLAVAARHNLQEKNINEQSFRPLREYRYQFDGQLSTGLPIPSTQSSATRLQTLVTIQPQDDRTVRLQLREVRFASIQNEFEPRRMQPFEECDEVKIESEHEKLLSLPIRFVYRHGMISEIEFSPEEQTWSANIKRAVLNMLQVNLLKKENERFETLSEEENQSFTTIERTIEGECEVLYTKTELPEKNQYQWTKSVNFEKCSSRPETIYGRRASQKCEQCEQTMSEQMMSSSVSTITLIGSAEQFLIKEVQLESQHMFAPINEQKQLLGAFVNNKMVLVYAGEVQKKIEEVRGDRKETLIYNPEWELAEEKFAQTGEEKYLRRLPQWNNKVQQVEKLLNQLAKQESEATLESAHIVSRIVKVVRVCSEEEINKIHRFVTESNKWEEKDAERIRQLYYDALAVAGTKVTISHMFEKVQKKQISAAKTIQLLKTLVEIRVPSEQIAEEIVNLCESDVVARNPAVEQTCWLTYGAVLNGLCGENNRDRMISHHESKKVCPRELKEKLTRKLVERLERASTRYEKVLALKTIANAAIDRSVIEIQKVILDRKAEKIVRMQAIDALRKLRLSMPRKIQSLLMPVYKDRTEVVEIRMAALHQLIQTLPEQAVVDQLVFAMEKERSQQVRAFTYTTLKAMSRSTNPCEKKMASRVTKALNQLPEVEYQALESRFASLPLFEQEYQTGAALNWAALFTNDSILPKEVMASVDSVFGGEWNKYFAQIGLYQQNLDVVISKLLRKFEETGFDQVVVRGKRAAEFRPYELLRSLYEKMRISRREISKDEPHAMLYLRFKDMDYAVLPLDIDTIPEMIKNIVREGKIELGDIERILTQGNHFTGSVASFLYENSRRIPTPMGMSVIMSSKMPTVAHVKGHIKVEMEPKNSKVFHGLRLRLVAEPKVASTNAITLQVVCPIVSSGIKMLHSGRVHVPIDAEIEFNWEKKLVIKTVVKAPETKRNIAHFQSRPVTFVRVWKKDMRQYPESVEKTVLLSESRYPMEQIEREYFTESTGIKMTVSGNLRRPFYSVESAFFGDNLVDVVIEPSTDAPREYLIRMEVETFEPVSRMEQPELENFLEKNEKRTHQRKNQMEEESSYEQDYEQDKDYETKRRESIRQYKSTNGYKHTVNFKVEAVGSRKTREAKATIQAVCDEKIRFCRLNVEARRSPLSEESREWELKATVQTLYPEAPKSLRQLKDLHREFNAIVEAKWGSEEKNTINMQIKGEQCPEQKKWIQRVERVQNKISEEQKLHEAAKLNQYRVIAKYELSPKTRFQINRLFSLLKVWKVWNTEYTVAENQEGRMQAKLTIEPENRRLFNLTVETPMERLSLKNVQMPVQLPTLNLRREQILSRDIKTSVHRMIKSERSECIVKSKEVQTFDRLFFKAPLTPCYSVLAKDCSSEQPQFAVLMKKVDKKSEDKKIKIINRENIYEVEPSEEKLIIKINGKQVESENKLEEHGITLKNEQLVVIDIDDVIVHFDGVEAKIQLSPLFKNKQCGLCGHFDGEKENDLRRADNFETYDVEEFHRSFLSEDDECEKDEPELRKKSNYKILSQETSSSEEYTDNEEEQKTVDPIKKVLVIERPQHVCISEKQVEQCPRGTRPVQKNSREVTLQLKCQPRSAEMARLVRQSSAQKTIDFADYDFEESEQYTKTIQVPTLCMAF